MRRHIWGCIGIFLVTACSEVDTSQQDEIISTFSVADGFRLELVAMEPLISDPVAMEIDENGDVYVVEMHGYPLDVGEKGVVKKLYDDNGDGQFDRSEVFCDKLVLPTGIMRWKQGVLVTDPPDLLYLEDSDGDGVADIKEVVITGFALSNPQHNFNSPLYGLDNWIYLANEGTYESEFFGDIFGDEGDEIHFPGDPDAPSLPRNANDLNLKVDLNNKQLALLSGDSQYGHTFNAWGHHFGTKNWSHIYHEVLPAHIIDRNQDLEVPSSMQYVPDYGIGFELYPITRNPEHQLLTDVGAITSSCGITWYLGDLFPEEYRDVVFIAEPTHNLVHSDIMYDRGATFGSKQQFQHREFLASTDGWFRPVNFYIGPDGALYMLDYHRKIIEHPEWISEEVLNSGDLYQGQDQGRIYRIIPNIGSSDNVDVQTQTHIHTHTQNIDLGGASTNELIAYLGHPNIWWRRNAQRLLVDRQDSGVVPDLKNFIKSANEMGALHGLWTLEGLGYFDHQLATWAMNHQTAGVRENAIKIAEIHRDEFPELEEKLILMAQDPNGKVRFQLLATLGYYESRGSAEARKQLMFSDLEDPWLQLAGLSARYVDALGLFRQAIIEVGNRNSEGAASLFKNLSKTIGKSGDASQINQAIEIISGNPGAGHNWWKSQAMMGLSQTVKKDLRSDLSRKSSATLESFFEDQVDQDLREGSLALLYALGQFDQQNTIVASAGKVATDPNMSGPFRADALNVLAWSDGDGNSRLFMDLIRTETDPRIRIAAIDALRHTHGSEECDFLIEQWGDLLPQERDLAVNVFSTSEGRQIQFLKAVESGQIMASVLGWGRTVRLLNSRNNQVRELAREVLEGNETISDSVWQQYQQALTLIGNPNNGQQVFSSACGTCHQISGQLGANYGPDLSAVRNRSKSGIMIDILKPNRSISDGYDLWTIEEKSGQTHSGIIVTENANTLTLRNPAGNEIQIQQQHVANRTAAELSAMPEGLHNQITPQQMADLLEYLKSGNVVE